MIRIKKNDGRSFQALLEMIFAEYERLGIATIRKVDPPVRVMGGGKFRRVIFMPNPWLDYVGTLKGGRAIHIEAKSTAGPTLGIASNGKASDGIKEHQQETAMRHVAFGAAVFYLWMNLEADDIRIVTPNMVAAQLATRKSLRWCDAHKIPPGPGLMIYDPLRFTQADEHFHPDDPYPGA